LPLGRARFPVCFALLGSLDSRRVEFVGGGEFGADEEVEGGGRVIIPVVDDDEDEVDSLLKGLPGFISSSQTRGDKGLGVMGLRTTCLPFPVSIAVSFVCVNDFDPVVGGSMRPVA
jgi:hypothetical protein